MRFMSGLCCLTVTLLLVIPDSRAQETYFKASIAHETGSWPEAVAIGDVNGDALPDVVMTTSAYFSDLDYTLFVFLQNSNGELEEPVTYSYSENGNGGASVAIGDFNNDGRNDVAVPSFGGLSLFYQQDSGGLAAAEFLNAARADEEIKLVRAGDFNNDSLLDIAAACWGSSGVDQGVEVFFQQDDGMLAAPVTFAIEYNGYNDLEAGDLNNDGLTDLAVLSGQSSEEPLGVLLQTQAGFEDAVYYALPELGGFSTDAHGFAFGDLNGDSLTDVAVSVGGNRPDAHLAVFHQTEAGVLEAGTVLDSYDIPEPVEIGRIDGDDLDDILTAHGGWNRAGIFIQTPAGGFEDYLHEIPYATHYNPHGMALDDFNSDGLPDIAIADYNNGLVVLYHSVPVLSTPTPTPTITPTPDDGPGGKKKKKKKKNKKKKKKKKNRS